MMTQDYQNTTLHCSIFVSGQNVANIQLRAKHYGYTIHKEFVYATTVRYHNQTLTTQIASMSTSSSSLSSSLPTAAAAGPVAGAVMAVGLAAEFLPSSVYTT